MSAEKNRRLPMRQIRAALATHLRAGERGKSAYKRADAALKTALELGLPLDTPITLLDGRVVILKDEFAASNTVFRAKRFSRYAVEDLKQMPRRPAVKEGGAA